MPMAIAAGAAFASRETRVRHHCLSGGIEHTSLENEDSFTTADGETHADAMEWMASKLDWDHFFDVSLEESEAEERNSGAAPLEDQLATVLRREAHLKTALGHVRTRASRLKHYLGQVEQQRAALTQFIPLTRRACDDDEDLWVDDKSPSKTSRLRLPPADVLALRLKRARSSNLAKRSPVEELERALFEQHAASEGGGAAAAADNAAAAADNAAAAAADNAAAVEAVEAVEARAELRAEATSLTVAAAIWRLEEQLAASASAMEQMRAEAAAKTEAVEAAIGFLIDQLSHEAQDVEAAAREHVVQEPQGGISLPSLLLPSLPSRIPVPFELPNEPVALSVIASGPTSSNTSPQSIMASLRTYPLASPGPPFDPLDKGFVSNTFVGWLRAKRLGASAELSDAFCAKAVEAETLRPREEAACTHVQTAWRAHRIRAAWPLITWPECPRMQEVEVAHRTRDAESATFSAASAAGEGAAGPGSTAAPAEGNELVSEAQPVRDDAVRAVRRVSWGADTINAASIVSLAAGYDAMNAATIVSPAARCAASSPLPPATVRVRNVSPFSNSVPFSGSAETELLRQGLHHTSRGVEWVGEMPSRSSHPGALEALTIAREGMALNDKGDFRNALLSFHHAVRLDCLKPNYWISAGNMHLKLYEYEDALRMYEHARKLPLSPYQTAMLNEKVQLATNAMRIRPSASAAAAAAVAQTISTPAPSSEPVPRTPPLPFATRPAADQSTVSALICDCATAIGAASVAPDSNDPPSAASTSAAEPAADTATAAAATATSSPALPVAQLPSDAISVAHPRGCLPVNLPDDTRTKQAILPDDTLAKQAIASSVLVRPFTSPPLRQPVPSSLDQPLPSSEAPHSGNRCSPLSAEARSCQMHWLDAQLVLSLRRDLDSTPPTSPFTPSPSSGSTEGSGRVDSGRVDSGRVDSGRVASENVAANKFQRLERAWSLPTLFTSRWRAGLSSRSLSQLKATFPATKPRLFTTALSTAATSAPSQAVAVDTGRATSAKDPARARRTSRRVVQGAWLQGSVVRLNPMATKAAWLKPRKEQVHTEAAEALAAEKGVTEKVVAEKAAGEREAAEKAAAERAAAEVVAATEAVAAAEKAAAATEKVAVAEKVAAAEMMAAELLALVQVLVLTALDSGMSTRDVDLVVELLEQQAQPRELLRLSTCAAAAAATDAAASAAAAAAAADATAAAAAALIALPPSPPWSECYSETSSVSDDEEYLRAYHEAYIDANHGLDE